MIEEHLFPEDASIAQAAAILEFETRHLRVRLNEQLLIIDLKGSLKNEFEQALENEPILRETIGRLLGLFVPLHIHITDIESARVIEPGKVKIILPHSRDVVIPLEREDAEKLADRLIGLIRSARKKEWERFISKRRIMVRERARQHAHRRYVPSSSYTTMPWYFPIEQVDNVPKLQPRRKRNKPTRKD